MADPSREHTTPPSQTAHLPPSSPWSNEGQTVAAWTLVVLVVVGGTVAGVGVLIARPEIFWVGLTVVVLGIVVGKILQLAGYGQGGAHTLARQAPARPAGRGQ